MSAPAAQTASTAAPAGQFDVRRMSWKRLVVFLVIAAVSAGGLTYLSENFFVLNADGLVLRERIVAAAPYEARIKQVFVRSGDYVQRGEPIAILESASMNRNLAELAAEKAKLKSSIAHLEARRIAADQLLPVATVNTNRLRELLRQLEQNRDRGMTNFAYLQQVTTATYAAEEKLASVRADRASVDAELRETRSALTEMETANENLRAAYADGFVLAGANGYVGGGVADPGEVLLPGSKVVEIYTSKPFVLAYLPETSFVGVEEGYRVQVTGAGRRTLARIEKILPIVEPLPPDFQKPVHARESGQLLRVSLSDDDDFLTKQKVHVTGCLIPKCAGFGEFTSAMTARASVALNHAYAAVIRMAAQEREFIMGSAASLPDLVRPANARHLRTDTRRRVAQSPEPASVPLPSN